MTPNSGYAQHNTLLEKAEARRCKMKSDIEAIQAMFAQCVVEKKEPEEEQMYLIGALPTVAGVFDKFDIEYTVDTLLPKVGTNARIGNGGFFKAMALQVPGSVFSSLSKTAEFFTKVDTDVFLGEDVTSEDINRHALN